MSNNYKVVKGLITQKLDDKTVIFDGEKSVLYTLNETASFIFKKLKAKKSENKIIGEVVKKYNVDEKKAKGDFSDLIKDLIKGQIIKLMV